MFETSLRKNKQKTKTCNFQNLKAFYFCSFVLYIAKTPVKWPELIRILIPPPSHPHLFSFQFLHHNKFLSIFFF